MASFMASCSRASSASILICRSSSRRLRRSSLFRGNALAALVFLPAPFREMFFFTLRQLFFQLFFPGLGFLLEAGFFRRQLALGVFQLLLERGALRVDGFLIPFRRFFVFFRPFGRQPLFLIGQLLEKSGLGFLIALLQRRFLLDQEHPAFGMLFFQALDFGGQAVLHFGFQARGLFQDPVLVLLVPGGLKDRPLGVEAFLELIFFRLQNFFQFGALLSHFPGFALLVFFPGGALALDFRFHELAGAVQFLAQELFLREKLPPVAFEIFIAQRLFAGGRFLDRVPFARQVFFHLLPQIFFDGLAPASVSAARRASSSAIVFAQAA